MDLAKDQKFNFGDEIANGIRVAKKQVCLCCLFLLQWKVQLIMLIYHAVPGIRRHKVI